MGGFTVLAALRRHLPGEDFIYLGVTARLPYGTKSAATVERYARQAAGAPDRKHQYGYGRAAYFWSLVSALGMFWLGAG